MKRSWFAAKGRGLNSRTVDDSSTFPLALVSPTLVTVIPESARPPPTNASISFMARYRHTMSHAALQS